MSVVFENVTVNVNMHGTATILLALQRQLCAKLEWIVIVIALYLFIFYAPAIKWQGGI